MTTLLSNEPKTILPDIKAATNMPFFDGKTLVFCQSTGTVSTTIATTGTIWKRIRQNKALAERMKHLPRSQQVTYRPWKLSYLRLERQDCSTHRHRSTCECPRTRARLLLEG